MSRGDRRFRQVKVGVSGSGGLLRCAGTLSARIDSAGRKSKISTMRPIPATFAAALLLPAAPIVAQTLTPACTSLCLRQVACPTSTSTTISGTVYAPNGIDTVLNVTVYIPNAPVAAMAEPATLSRSSPLIHRWARRADTVVACCSTSTTWKTMACQTARRSQPSAPPPS